MSLHFIGLLTYARRCTHQILVKIKGLELLLYANTPVEGQFNVKRTLMKAKKFVLIYFKTCQGKKNQLKAKKYGKTKSNRG